MENKIILAEDVEVEKVTVEMYKVKGDNTKYSTEDSARYAGSTHKLCKCGNTTDKYYINCSVCRGKNETERYDKLEYKEWDTTTPLCIYGSDTYFFDIDSIYEYAEENEEEVSELKLVICQPNYLHEISEDYWQDIFPENWDEIADGNKEFSQKLKEFNEIIRQQPPFSWGEGNYKTSI